MWMTLNWRTVDSQHMRLRHFRVSQSSARVIAGVDQLYFGEVQRTVTKHPHVLVA